MVLSGLHHENDESSVNIQVCAAIKPLFNALFVQG